jgi:hypothetical protein
MMKTDAATSIRLTQEQVYFLDSFRARVRRDTSYPMPRGAILQALVETLSAASLDLQDVTSEFELTRLLCEASARHRKRACK